MPIALRDQQRQLAPSGIHAGQHRRPGLGRSGILIVRQVGELLPPLGILFGIVEKSRDGRVYARRSQLHGRRIAMEVVAAGGQKCGQQFAQSRSAPAAVTQRSPPAQKKNAAAPAIDIFAQQFLLQRRKVARVDGADDDARVPKQILRPHRKPIGEFARIADSLPIDLVFAGAQHRDHLHGGIIVFSPANELEFPARFALDIRESAASHRSPAAAASLRYWPGFLRDPSAEPRR